MVREGHTELGPFYYHRPLPEGEGTETAWLWPFFQKMESPKVRQFAFRPLLNWRHEDTGGPNRHVFEVQGVWPLFQYRKTQGVTRLKIRILPIFWHRRFHHAGGDEEVDTALTPVLFAGSGEKLGSYFALFPLGGELKGFFAQDRIRFFLFPLFAEAWEGEHHSWHVLWPIFRYGEGGGKSSFRLFPFFGWKERENWYKKLFILWPLFARSQEWLGTEHPTDSWFFLPFYGRQRTPFGRISYYLFPFFSYQRNEKPGNRYRAWTLPWPFYQATRGDRYWQTYFFPLWGKYRVADTYEKQIALYPIYWAFSYRGERTLRKRRYVLPFYWDWHELDSEGLELRRRIKLWPFLDISENLDEQWHLNALSPLWFRDPHGWERNYGDFWTLYRRERTPEGKEIERFLWYRRAVPAPPDEGPDGRPPANRQAPDADEGPGKQEGVPLTPAEDIIGQLPFGKELVKPLEDFDGFVPEAGD